MAVKKLAMKVLVHLALYSLLLSATTSGAKKAGKLRIIQLEQASKYFGCSSNHFCSVLQVIWTPLLNSSPYTDRYTQINLDILFILCLIAGASIKISELDSNIVTIGLSILVVTGIVRIIVTILIAFGDNFNIKERVSWVEKGSSTACIVYVFILFSETENNRFFPFLLFLPNLTPPFPLFLDGIRPRYLWPLPVWQKQPYKQLSALLCWNASIPTLRKRNDITRKQ